MTSNVHEPRKYFKSNDVNEPESTEKSKFVVKMHIFEPAFLNFSQTLSITTFTNKKLFQQKHEFKMIKMQTQMIQLH